VILSAFLGSVVGTEWGRKKTLSKVVFSFFNIKK